MHDRMLVPLDGSDLAQAMVSQVQDMAAAYGAEVNLLRVLAGSGVLLATAAQERDEAEERLTEVGQALLGKGGQCPPHDQAWLTLSCGDCRLCPGQPG